MPKFHPSALEAPAWDDGRWDPLPSLRIDMQADVCVIGLGGSGLAAVESLSDRGLTVVGLDAGPVAGGAAGRNGGLLLAGTARFYHETAAALGRNRARQIYRQTLEEIEHVCSAAPEAVRRSGSLRIATTPAERYDCEHQYAALRADGFSVERYAGPEGHGLLLPTDASFNPLQRCRSLAKRLIAGGCTLFERSPAVALGAGSVRTTAGRIRCRHIVVAVDGGLDELLPELSDRVRTARLQMLATAPVAEKRFPRPVYARFGYEYWQQTDDGRIVLGGFRDAGGEAEWTRSTRTSTGVQQRLNALLRDTLAIDAPITHRWAASVGYTSDALPIIAEVRPRIWAVGGYNGTGNVLGALCARAVADLIITGQSAWAALLAAP